MEVPDCLSLTNHPQGKLICNQKTHEWCQWNEKYSICENSKALKSDAIFIDWYDMRQNCFWLIWFPVTYYVIFVIAKYIGSVLLKKSIISQSYLEKCVIYIFEILGMIPIAFKIFYPKFIYDPVFNPSKYTSITPQEYGDMYASFVVIAAGLSIMYLIEMIYAAKMRWQLKLHHWLTILSSLVYLHVLKHHKSFVCCTAVGTICNFRNKFYPSPLSVHACNGLVLADCLKSIFYIGLLFLLFWLYFFYYVQL